MMNTKIDGGYFPTSLMRGARGLTIFLMTAAMLLGLGIRNALANGEINFVAGKAQVLNAAGDARAAGKGGRVVPGEVLATGADGEIHVIMDDNALIAIRPNSRLKIDTYVAEGDEKDSAAFSLIRGQLRSITGWIGKIAPKNYAIRTPSATIGIRGTDHEVAVIELGTEAGTFDKVNTGETLMKTAFGEVSVQPGRAGFAGKASTERPVLLAAIPAFYKPTPNEQLINQAKKALELSLDQRLKRKQGDVRRQGGLNEQGNARISNSCTLDPSPMDSFNDFIRAYELGNTALMRNRLDPSMIGYLRFLEGINQDNNRFKQIRLTLMDTQLQCGPDVTVVQFLWEKRFLDVTTFAPGLFTGRATVLMHRNGVNWQFAAVSGDNPFSSQSGVLGQLTFGPVGTPAASNATGTRSKQMDAAAPVQSFSISSVTSAPGALPLTVEVLDPDLAGTGTLQVQIVTNQGDAEKIDLFEVSPGRFSRSSLYFSSNTAVPGNNVLEVGPGAILTLRYVDQNPGGNRPATLLARSLNTSGSPVSAKSSAPDPFNFNSQTAQPNTKVGSNKVTITGNTAPAVVTIVGGSYKIDDGPFTTAPGTVSSGQTITVQVISSPTPGATASATLTVGGVSGVFTVITVNPSGGGGTTTPNPFSFVTLGPQLPSKNVPSDPPVVITGNTLPAPVSIVGGSYSIDGRPFTNAPGTIDSGHSVVVSVLSSATLGGSVTATLTVGGVSAPFTVTTQTVASPNPNPFSFRSPAPQPPGVPVTSDTISISGNNVPAPISIVGGSYSIDGRAFTSAPGTISSAQTVTLKVLSSSTALASVTATLTVGNVNGSFTVTTQAATSPVPNPFGFTSVTQQPLGRPATSNTIPISGNTAPAPVTIVGGTYSINGLPFTNAPGTILAGQTIAVATTNASTPATSVVVSLTIGGVVGTFTATTIDTIPNPFGFKALTAQQPLSTVTASATITGIDTPTPIGIVGGTFSINGGPASTSGAITNGQTVTISLTNSRSENFLVSANLTIGGVSGSFNSTTWTTTPNAYFFTPSSVTPKHIGFSCISTTNTVTITGITAPSAPISINGAGFAFSINGGAFVTSGNIVSGSSVAVRGTITWLRAGPNLPQTGTLNIGNNPGGSATFTITCL